MINLDLNSKKMSSMKRSIDKSFDILSEKNPSASKKNLEFGEIIDNQNTI